MKPLNRLFVLLKKAGIALLFFGGILLVVASMLNLRLLVDTQSKKCLPFTIGLVRYQKVTEFKRGDIVAFTPGHIMGPAFKGNIVVKMVGGLPGDRVVVNGNEFRINDKLIGDMAIIKRAAKYMNRPVESFFRDEIIPNGMLMMVGTEPQSFDGRYWGYLYADDVLGVVYPIF